MKKLVKNQAISPTQIKEICHCLYGLQLSFRQTAKRLGISRDTVTKYHHRFQTANLSWPLPPFITDDELMARMVHKKSTQPRSAITIDFEEVHSTMQRKRGATLGVLYEEWLLSLSKEDTALSYSQFTRRYRQFVHSLQLSLRHTHHPGELVYVDYSGQTVPITDAITGEVWQAQIFIGVLGYSNYTYCEATASQRSEDWNMSHARMFKYFNGVTQIVVPDNLKSAVATANRFAPMINESYSKMCEHFNVHPFPARSYQPKDKPKAEAGVLLAQRWILFRLRQHKFFDLATLNQQISILLAQLNNKKFQKISGSRYSRFIEIEQACLQALPYQEYQYEYWGKVRAGFDYHVCINKHYYSVPHQLRGKEFEFSKSTELIKLYFNHQLIVTHVVSNVIDGTSTKDEHLHPSHQALFAVTPENVLLWAEQVGSGCVGYVEYILEQLVTNYQKYRFFTGFKKLVNKYAPDQIDSICRYLLSNKIFKLYDVKATLKNMLETILQANQVEEEVPLAFKEHRNLRDKGYFAEQLHNLLNIENDDATDNSKTNLKVVA